MTGVLAVLSICDCEAGRDDLICAFRPLFRMLNFVFPALNTLRCLCNHVLHKVPLNYHKLLVRLHAENKQRLSFDEVVDIAEKCSMPTAPTVISLRGEVKDALHTLHRLGQLLWWGDSERLNNTVVLDPQWLITAFTAIIRDRDLHAIPWLDAELDRLIATGEKCWAELDRAGIKTREALVNARAGAPTVADVRELDDIILALDQGDAVRLLRDNCVLVDSLFDTVWPVSRGNADDALRPGVGDASAALADGQRYYTSDEQEVRRAFFHRLLLSLSRYYR
jgi:hypothetical protein